jgi:hypothetical protein
MHRELRTTRENLRVTEPNPIHQADADRRDWALAQLDVILPAPTIQPVKILKREPLEVRTRTTFEKDRKRHMRTMERELKELESDSGPRKEGRKTKNDLTWRRGEIKPATIDIAMIGSAGFHRNLKNKANTLFVTNLYEIDRIIDDKLQAEYDASDD